jgi:hypothetical protein
MVNLHGAAAASSRLRSLGIGLVMAGATLSCSPGSVHVEQEVGREPAVPIAQDVYPAPDGAWEVHEADFEVLIERARRDGVTDRPFGPRITGFGRLFLGLPYVAHTLDLPGPEQLVVNLKELDCVTLVENALAFAMVADEPRYDEFLRALALIRYRGGQLEGYTSRLHYFTDWIADNERKGLLRDITRELGGVPATRRIEFMSSNRDAYRQLRENPALVDSIRQIEATLNDGAWYWIPQDRIDEVAEGIQEGDIIGITTAIAGLDVSHTGLATWVDGRLHLLHAPDVGHPVEISAQPLGEKIRTSRLQTGIVVARAIAG